MAINLKDLLLPKSAQQILNDTLAYLASPPDPNLVTVRTANWRTGGPYRTLLWRVALEAALLYQVIAAFAGSAFLRFAQGLWLDWLGEDYFSEPRQAAQFATTQLTVPVPLGAGPYGPLEVRAQTTDGKIFISVALVTIPAGAGSVTFGARAELAGSEYNVGANTITQLVTPNVLGLSVTNPGIASGGADQEPDDRYRQRLAVKWGTLSTGSTQAAYAFWALTASREVQKVRVYSNLNGAGAFEYEAVTVVLAGNGTTVSAQAVADVQAYILPRIPLNAKLYVVACSVVTLTVTGTVKVFTPFLTTAAASIATSLQRLGERVPIGSWDAGPVTLAEFTDAVVYDPIQVYDVTFANPLGPVALGKFEILVPVNGLTLQGVL